MEANPAEANPVEASPPPEVNPVEAAWAKALEALAERKAARRESDRFAQSGSSAPDDVRGQLQAKQEAYRQALADWWRLKEANMPRRDNRSGRPPRQRQRGRGNSGRPNSGNRSGDRRRQP